MQTGLTRLVCVVADRSSAVTRLEGPARKQKRPNAATLEIIRQQYSRQDMVKSYAVFPQTTGTLFFPWDTNGAASLT